MDINNILKSMTNQKPNEKQIDKIESLRLFFKNLAIQINQECEDGRNKSLALTHLETSLMWAVKSVILD